MLAVHAAASVSPSKVTLAGMAGAPSSDNGATTNAAPRQASTRLPTPATGDAGFPPSARLHHPEEFAPALKGRRLARGALLVLTAANNAASSGRLGLVVPKRYAAHAVTRNTIKRVVREAFRHISPQLPARDFVIRVHSKVPALSLTALRRQVRAEADAHFQRVLP